MYFILSFKQISLLFISAIIKMFIWDIKINIVTLIRKITAIIKYLKLNNSLNSIFILSSKNYYLYLIIHIYFKRIIILYLYKKHNNLENFKSFKVKNSLSCCVFIFLFICYHFLIIFYRRQLFKTFYIQQL